MRQFKILPRTGMMPWYSASRERANAAESGIALDDIDLALVGVARAAVHKLLHTVGKVEILREVFLDAHARLFRLLAGRFAC